MGLLLDRLKQIELGVGQNEQISNTPNDQNNLEQSRKTKRIKGSYRETNVKFPDLSAIPPELSLQILKYLNATDLCLAACVWSSLANDDILWQSLCKSTWGNQSTINI